MKNILNPKFAKEKVAVIEDSSSQEDLEDEEVLDSKLVQSKKEYLVTLKSSPKKYKVVEQQKVCSTEKDRPLEVPIEKAYKHEEDDDFIFTKMNIPWLLGNTSTTKEGLCIDSEIENLQKTVKQCKYQISFLSETNEGLVMTKRRLREDLNDINTYYQELISVSKEALRINKQTQNQLKELKQTIQDLTQQNERISKKVEDLEAEQQRTKRKSQSLKGIALLAEAAKNL